MPAVSKQLEENATGKGRKGKAAVVNGSIQLFKLADGLEDSAKQVASQLFSLGQKLSRSVMWA